MSVPPTDGMTPAELVDRYSALVVSHAEVVAERDALREALAKIVRRERRSEYSSIYAAPGEFAAVALAALEGHP